MTDIIENAGQPENTAPAAGEKKPENTPKKEKQPMTFKRLYKEWILPFGLEILALFLIVKFVFFVPIVPTGSMEPTIAEHSALFALRVHDLEKLERGDIIVFTAETPELAGTTLIKRLIGLPGDHVEIDENGTVTINGEVQQESYVVYQYAFPVSLMSRRGITSLWAITGPIPWIAVTGRTPMFLASPSRDGRSSPFSRSVILASCSKAAFITFRNGAMSK